MCPSSNICTKISGVWHHYMVIFSVMLINPKMNQLMKNLRIPFRNQSSQTGITVSNWVSLLFSSSRTGITDYQKRSPILNLNNFFSKHFKKNLNGQKFGNSFIFKLPKFGENHSKTVIHFFSFLRVLSK